MPRHYTTEQREAQRARTRRHYQENKDYYKAKARQKEQELRAFIKEKKDVPCTDCGQKYPYYVMQFDHRDPSQKEYGLANLHLRGSKQKIIDEIAKCDVVCANCHAERTHQQRQPPPVA